MNYKEFIPCSQLIKRLFTGSLALIFLLGLMESKLKMVILILVIFVVFGSCWILNKEKGKRRNVYGKEDSTYQRNLKHSFQFQLSCSCKCGELLSGFKMSLSSLRDYKIR